MIQDAIQAVVEGRNLTFDQAAAAMDEIMSGEATPAQFGALVTALRMKGETVDEIAGMVRSMREKSLRVEVAGNVVDTSGTGGDNSGSFNISTTAAFVVAGAGGEGRQAWQSLHVRLHRICRCAGSARSQDRSVT